MNNHNIQKTIDKACSLFNEGKRRKALNIIYNEIDDALLDGDFELVDNFFKNFDPSQIPLTLQLGILTITLAAHYKVPNRIRFYQSVLRGLGVDGEKPERIHGLMAGLEGPTTKNINRYLLQLEELEKVRERHNGENSEEEDRLLENMDDSWWAMSRDEIDVIEEKIKNIYLLKRRKK